MSKNLRSDAAYKRALKLWDDVRFEKAAKCFGPGEFGLFTSKEGIVAEISLRDIINKRKSLEGIESKLRSALRTKKKKIIRKAHGKGKW